MLYPMPIDKNDPDAVSTAMFLGYPDTLSEKALKAVAYFEDSAFLFQYKGRLVLTDEGGYLTDAGSGTMDDPIGFPRWVGDTFEELNEWLEIVADEIVEEGLV